MKKDWIFLLLLGALAPGCQTKPAPKPLGAAAPISERAEQSEDRTRADSYRLADAAPRPTPAPVRVEPPAPKGPTRPGGRLAVETQGTVIGAVLGTVVGGAVGYATDGRNDIARGAAIGAGAGAVAGFAYGTHVAKREADYSSRDAWLDACIASAHRVNSNAYAYSRSLESRIARLEARSRAARTSRNKSEAQAIKSEITSLKVEAKQKTVVVDKEIGDQQRAVREGCGARNYARLKSEVNSLQQTKGTLDRQINRLAGLENQLGF